MGHAGAPRLLVIVGLGLAAAGPFANDDEDQDQDEDAGDKDHDADHLLQADVPGGGDQVAVGVRRELARRPAVTQRAVALVGAVGVLALASVATRVLDALIDITQAPGQRQQDCVRPVSV